MRAPGHAGAGSPTSSGDGSRAGDHRGRRAAGARRDRRGWWSRRGPARRSSSGRWSITVLSPRAGVRPLATLSASVPSIPARCERRTGHAVKFSWRPSCARHGVLAAPAERPARALPGLGRDADPPPRQPDGAGRGGRSRPDAPCPGGAGGRTAGLRRVLHRLQPGTDRASEIDEAEVRRRFAWLNDRLGGAFTDWRLATRTRTGCRCRKPRAAMTWPPPTAWSSPGPPTWATRTRTGTPPPRRESRDFRRAEDLFGWR